MATASLDRLDLLIEGMTCASCAARVQRSLSGLDGVDGVSVNYATETATVTFDGGRVDRARLVEAVEGAGYRARPPGKAEGHDHEHAGDGLGLRLAVSALLALPVLLVSMIPALRFDGWEVAALALAAPVVLWGGWPFHRAALAGARHLAAGMDTLISLGTLAALGWSAAVVASGADQEVYLEVASVVTVFLLAGRWLEARAKRRAGAALTALLELGAKEASLLDADGRERRVPVEELRVGDRFLVRPGERIATDGVVEAGSSAVERVAADRRERAGRGRARRRGRRRDHQRGRPPGGARDARRRRHRPLPDRPAGARGAVGHGAGAAPGGPRLRRLRAGGAGARCRDPGGLAGGRRRRGGGLHGRGGRADHRLPLRPRAGHAGRAAGRHRPRRPARHPDPRARGAGVDAPRRHRRARQDGHRDGRRDGPGRRRPRRGRGPRRGAPPGRRARGRLRAPDRPGDRGRGPRGGCGRSRRPRASRTARAWGSRASWTAAPPSWDGPRCWPTGAWRWTTAWRRRSSGPRPRAAPRSPSPGTARCAGCWSWRTGSGPPAPRPSACCAPRGCARCC